MRGCGTNFVEGSNEPLSEADIQTLNQIELLAYRHEFYARRLKEIVLQCKEHQTIEGLYDMVAMTFNAQQYQPQYGGGGANLPVGKYKGVIVNSAGEQSQKGGGYLALSLTPIEGPLAGQVHIDRLNLHHTNPQTVEIANKQLSAYCHVTGKYQFNDTAELHNIPFMFEIGYQKGHEPTAEKPQGGYTEVKAIFDVNGNEPGKAGAGAPAAAAAPAAAPPAAAPPAEVAPAAAPAAGWGAPAPATTAPAAAPAAAAWGAAAAPTTAAPAGPAPWGAPA